MTAGARQPRNSRILNVSWLPNSNWDRLMRAIWPVPQRWSHDAFRYASSSVRAPIKRAVIIAIQNCPGYPGLDNLSGPHNDIEMHKETLHLLDFNSENVKVLSDQEPRDSASYPNRQNIERELRELGSLQNGDLGFLAYSGHAVRGHGSDETYIVPADGNPNDRDTLIKPQELNRWLVRCLAPGATLLVSNVNPCLQDDLG
ncbi:hypothetical protein FRC03_003818 [Tulasnella sp. 419]|nr:hypothetical protein FRC02_004421 [Tulasnella sp. 418]KAG8941984.1 hypothetical protein FRC03_003818 [Tulasnella sp. 419]